MNAIKKLWHAGLDLADSMTRLARVIDGVSENLEGRETADRHLAFGLESGPANGALPSPAKRVARNKRS